MSSVVVSGDTSGAITLAAPAVSGSTTLTLPATTGTVLASNSASTINSGTSSSMTLQTNGTTALTIDTSQNVGIGTTSPSSKLNVNGKVTLTGGEDQQIEWSNNSQVWRVNNSTTGRFYLYDVTGAKFPIGISAGSGNICIDITSTYTALGVGGTERMRIDSSGNVLIGTTTSPAGTKELVLGGDYIEGVVAIGTVTTTNTISLANGTVQTATLTASTACTFTMPTAIAGKSFMLLLKQAAATGNGTATFTSVKWNSLGAPTITATAGKMDILSFVSDGTNWYGSYTQGYTP
jgi:hypothetical protein